MFLGLAEDGPALLVDAELDSLLFGDLDETPEVARFPRTVGRCFDAVLRQAGPGVIMTLELAREATSN
jgi:hypothetical protein